MILNVSDCLGTTTMHMPISDANFKDIWKNLKSVVHRIQKYMYNTGRNVNYEQELIKMESSKIAQDHLESCKLLLQALMNIQQLTAIKGKKALTTL